MTNTNSHSPRKMPSFDLATMLTYRRPGRSSTEEAFITRYIDSVPGMQKDECGNRFISLGKSNVMFSSHTDSVHTKPGMQKVCIDNIRNEYFTDDPESNCLGADCATGVYIMLKLIASNRPGLYVFHRDEETGGTGSIWIAKNNPALLEGIDFCIALDRKGQSSIITHQFERCASNAFSQTLALQFEDQNLFYEADDTGVFTDSANYIGLIRECTNLSVGYSRQHTKHETQDTNFPDMLADALCKMDIESIIPTRNCDDPDDIHRSYARYGSYNTRVGVAKKAPSVDMDDPLGYDELLALAVNSPETVALILYNLSVTKADVQDAEDDLSYSDIEVKEKKMDRGSWDEMLIDRGYDPDDGYWNHDIDKIRNKAANDVYQEYEDMDTVYKEMLSYDPEGAEDYKSAWMQA